MKKILSALLVMLVMVSCNKQEVVECNNTVVIYLNGMLMTRSALTSDPKAVENNVNTLTVGVFAADGTVKTIKDFTGIGTSKSVSLRVPNISSTDKVLCSVNTPNGMFMDVKNIQDFNNKEVTLDNSVSKDGVNLVANNLPMYGESGISMDGTNYIANVDAYHLNSKVTLNMLKTDIVNNGTFAPREIFLMNVPTAMKISYISPYTSYGYYHGSLNSAIPNQAQKLYLGYGNINNPINQLFFYTSPNNTTKYTQIVVSGMYDPDGNGPMQQKMTYYPIIVDKQLLPNRNYVLNISVKGIGVDDPTKPLDYSNLIVTLSIKDFVDVTKDIQLD